MRKFYSIHWEFDLNYENSYSGGCETVETPNMFLKPSILSLVTILIWSYFILKRFVLQVKVVIVLFNLESLL